jgi:hypothetical protein
VRGVQTKRTSQKENINEKRRNNTDRTMKSNTGYLSTRDQQAGYEL